MNDLSSTVGLVARQTRDIQSVTGNVQHMLRQLIDGRRTSTDRPGGLAVRAALCAVLGHVHGRDASDIAREHFQTDRDLDRLLVLRAAVNPANTTVATWAAELVQTVTADLADRLIPQSVLMQLRAAGIAYELGRGLIRAPTWAPTATGGFIAENAAIPVAALVFGAITLGGKKAASIVAIDDELLLGAPAAAELTLRTILSESLGMTIDNILLGSSAATAAAPAGLLAGITPLTPTAGGGTNALLGDIKQLIAAISPALRPVIIASAVQAASLGILAPNATAAVVASPNLAAGTVICVDAASFASALGIPQFRASQAAALVMDTAAGPPSAVGSPNTVAAPLRSTFQTDTTALRSIVPCDWSLRRSGAVAVVTGATW